MKTIAFDTESHLIRPGMACPRPVCLSWSDNGRFASLLDRREGLPWLSAQLKDTDVVLVGHNVVYDLAIFAAEDPAWMLPLVFEAIGKGRVRDTMIRQSLIDIARGEHKFRRGADGTVAKTSYGLADLALLHLGEVVAKGEETWRLRYGELDGVPLEEWPEAAREYAANDARVTYRLWDHLFKLEAWDVPDEVAQNKAAWAFQLAKIWGIRTNAPAVAELRAELERDLGSAYARLQALNFVRSDGTRDMKLVQSVVAAVYAFDDRHAPTTAKGGVSTSEDVLVDSGDPDLALLASTSEMRTNLSRYVPMLELGTKVPMNPGWKTLVETGRAACEKPNLMNPPRKGKIRETFVPRAGFLFAACDYDAAELRSWAQVCLDLLGYSAMADALIAGHDLHVMMAAEVLGIPFEEAWTRYQAGDPIVVAARQTSKKLNFGLPGGMGAERLAASLQEDGIECTVDQAREYIAAWRRRWLEAVDYFKHINAIVGPAGEGTAIQIRSGRVRGRVGYCDCANGFFQGLTADGAKAALWKVSYECYVDSSSPLYGSRVVLFLHDELILEVPEERASAAAKRLSEVMCAEMAVYLPDVPVTATPVLLRRWLKGAKPVLVDGELVPSRPEKREGKTIWVPDLPEKRAA